MPCRLVAAFGFEAPHFSGPPGEVAVSPLKFLIEFRSLHNLTANWGYEKGGARSLADHNAWIGKGLAFFLGVSKSVKYTPKYTPKKGATRAGLSQPDLLSRWILRWPAGAFGPSSWEAICGWPRRSVGSFCGLGVGRACLPNLAIAAR